MAQAHPNDRSSQFHGDGWWIWDGAPRNLAFQVQIACEGGPDESRTAGYEDMPVVVSYCCLSRAHYTIERNNVVSK
jgi:hypothetical protein